MAVRKVFLRTAYNYDRDAATLESGFKDDTPGLAVQSSKEECDINTIMKRFGVTGQLPSNMRPLTYGDFDEIYDFQTAQNAVVAARESFMELPAEIRARFRNDPGMFVDFCSDEKNLDEMRKMGLAVPAKEPPPPAAPSEPTPPKAAEAKNGPASGAG